ncbi:hypothetical protein [Streptomyces sp. NPDC029003]|uniref:hypothetical protein n=1 Tax=Streptomyces sp. NPDC029003 TaxID=3155125 RepID=UPI0033D0C1D6
MIITEGPSDERILRRAFGEGAVYFAAGSRSTALEQSRTLHSWRQGYFLSIVDRDFDDTVADFESENIPIHAYENADLEAMLCVSAASAELLAEFGSMAKIEAQGGFEQVIERLFLLVEPVSRLRRANIENDWGLTFDSIDLRSKIEKKSLNLKIQSYCAALNDSSRDAPGQGLLIKYATGQIALKKVPSCPRGTVPYFRGRDFLAMLSASLCGCFGTRRPQTVEPEILEGALRLGGSIHLKDGPWGQELSSAIAELSKGGS